MRGLEPGEPVRPGAFYDLVRDNEEATKKMKTFDAMFWATGGFNLVVCLSYVFNRFLHPSF